MRIVESVDLPSHKHSVLNDSKTLKVFEEASHCMASVSIKGSSTCVTMVTITLVSKVQRIYAILKLLPKSLAVVT